MTLKNRDKKRLVLCILSWLSVIACMAMIFTFSAQPDTQSAQLSGDFRWFIKILFNTEASQLVVRKAAHAFEFFLLSVFVFNASLLTWRKPRPFFSFLFTVLYAITDEIHQHFVPGRACRFSDIIIDALGAISGILLCLAAINVLQRLKRRRSTCKEKQKK
jgi:VanZ family protein